jgi:glycosyltransferase involved in cell wall biosynthesis
MSERLRVCLVLEGSYPYITGGVSAWVQDIVQGLPDIDFCLFTISPAANQPLRYKLPPNVVDHRDIVLSAPTGTAAKPEDKDAMLESITGIHARMFGGEAPDLTEMIRQIPEGYNLHRDSVKSQAAWDMVVASNQRRNPLYPFSDYYWAWQSAHDMIFRVLASVPPEADIYHAISTGFAGLAALAARIRRNKVLLLTEHGLYHKEREIEIRKSGFVQGYQRDMWIKTYNKLSAICYAWADGITALFEENRQKQLELGAPKDRTVVIPNGIDVERFTGVVKVKKPGFHVGLVGRVVPIKDIKTFIATAKIILDEIPEARFYAIGPTDEDPDYYEDCKALVESLRIQDRFEFTGRQNVLDYYAFLDVMLLTSVREAQPLVILEGWSALVPCVSTRVGNVPEMLDYDERFLADSKDAAKLAEGVRFVHRNPDETARINEKNKAKVLSLYDKKDLLVKYRELYRRMKELR